MAHVHETCRVRPTSQQGRADMFVWVWAARRAPVVHEALAGGRREHVHMAQAAGGRVCSSRKGGRHRHRRMAGGVSVCVRLGDGTHLDWFMACSPLNGVVTRANEKQLQ